MGCDASRTVRQGLYGHGRCCCWPAIGAAATKGGRMQQLMAAHGRMLGGGGGGGGGSATRGLCVQPNGSRRGLYPIWKQMPRE